MKNRKINLELKPMLGFRLLPDNHKSAGVSSAKVGDKTINPRLGRFILIGAKPGQKNG